MKISWQKIWNARRNRTAVLLTLVLLVSISATVWAAVAYPFRAATSVISGIGQDVEGPVPALGNHYSRLSSQSFNGEWVAYESLATDLVDGDVESGVWNWDIFLRHNVTPGDYSSDVIYRVTRADNNQIANSHSNAPVIWRDYNNPARDGQFGAFQSLASDLDVIDGQTADDNDTQDVFLFELREGIGVQLQRVSLPDKDVVTAGIASEANGPSGGPVTQGKAPGDPVSRYNKMPVDILRSPVRPGQDLYVGSDAAGDPSPSVIFESSATNLTYAPAFIVDPDAGDPFVVARSGLYYKNGYVSENSQGVQQIFMRNVREQTTQLLTQLPYQATVSYNPASAIKPANGDCTQPVASAVSGYYLKNGTDYRPIVMGRFVTFTCMANNLVTGVGSYPDGQTQVYLLDRDYDEDGILDEYAMLDLGNPIPAVKFYLVSTGYTPAGLRNVYGNSASEHPSLALSWSSISRQAVVDLDGDSVLDEVTVLTEPRLRVAFHSFASNLLPTDPNSDVDTNDVADVYLSEMDVRKLTLGHLDATRMIRLSRTSGDCTSGPMATPEPGCKGGDEGDGDSLAPNISMLGNLVSFTSYATNLVEGDDNLYCTLQVENRLYKNCPDIFIRSVPFASDEMSKGRTWRVSVTSEGRQAKYNSGNSRLNGNGRFVTFATFGDMRYDGDRNWMPNPYNPTNPDDRLDIMEVFMRDQGDPPGNPQVHPSFGEFYAYINQTDEIVFTVYFLADSRLTADPVVVDAEDPGDDKDVFIPAGSLGGEEECRVYHEGTGGDYDAGSTCIVTIRFDRSISSGDQTDARVRHAYLELQVQERRVGAPIQTVRIDLRGYSISGFVPLISP